MARKHPISDRERSGDQNQLGRDSYSKTIPVIEEQLQVDKQQIDTGVVRVRKEIHEKEVIVEGSISRDEMTVQRIPINQIVTNPPPPVRYEGDKMIVSVLQEELVIQKRLVLVEELHITKNKVTKDVEEPISLKREEVIVEKDARGADSGKGI